MKPARLLPPALGKEVLEFANVLFQLYGGRFTAAAIFLFGGVESIGIQI
jgi:hypothetical protein